MIEELLFDGCATILAKGFFTIDYGFRGATVKAIHFQFLLYSRYL
jgi:hypothetical protein